jgi:UDP:flavonoid glycosyltransferase YjiC (YdhE family)
VGVPYLGLITNPDQLIFSKAASRTGACEFIRQGDVNEHTLRQFVQRMLTDEKYQVAAKTVASRMTDSSETCKKFEEVIASIIAERRGGRFVRPFRASDVTYRQ